MPVKCTYGDLDRLRGSPTQAGLFQKLWSAEFVLAVDGHRVRKFCRSLEPAIKEYEEELVKLGRTHGEPVEQGFKIPPEKMRDFLVAKRALDAVECEVSVVPLVASTWSKISLSAAQQDALEKFVEPLPDEADVDRPGVARTSK